MTVTVANTANTNSVLYWRTRTNELAHAMSTKAVTVDSNAAVGNAVVNGSFQSNVMYVSDVYGGTIDAPANLTFQTNVSYSGKINLGLAANVSISSGNATHRVLMVNPDFSLQVSKILLSDVSEMNVSSSSGNQALIYNASESRWKNRAIAISDVTSLQANLDSKSNTGHTHTISNITSLQTTLDGKSNVDHGHAISEITSLQANLNSKSNVGHTHAISEVTNLQTTLDGKSNTGHTHTIANITSLQTTLDAKANTASVIAIPASSAQGDLLYHNGTTWTRLAAGTAGQGLRSGGAGANPTWGNQWEVVSILTASNSAELVATNLSIYRAIRLTFNNLRPSTDTQANLHFSTDNGVTYSTTGALSGSSIWRNTSGAAGAVNTDESQVWVGNQIGGASTDGGLNGSILITNFNVAVYGGINGVYSYGDFNSITHSVIVALLTEEGVAYNALRFRFGTGNIVAGSLIVEGIR